MGVMFLKEDIAKLETSPDFSQGFPIWQWPSFTLMPASSQILLN